MAMTLFFADLLANDLLEIFLFALTLASLITLGWNLRHRYGEGRTLRFPGADLVTVQGLVASTTGSGKPGIIQEQSGANWRLPGLELVDEAGRRWRVCAEQATLIGARRGRYQSREVLWLAGGDRIALAGTPLWVAGGESSYRQPAAEMRLQALRITRSTWLGQRWLGLAALLGLAISLLALAQLKAYPRYRVEQVRFEPQQADGDLEAVRSHCASTHYVLGGPYDRAGFYACLDRETLDYILRGRSPLVSRSRQ